MLGYSPDQLLGGHGHELFHCERMDSAAAPWGECPVYGAMRSEEVVELADEMYARKDGSSFPIEFTASPIVDGHQITGAVVAFRDITKRRAVDRMKNEFTRWSVTSCGLRSRRSTARSV